jgi:hypothetical protein
MVPNCPLVTLTDKLSTNESTLNISTPLSDLTVKYEWISNRSITSFVNCTTVSDDIKLLFNAIVVDGSISTFFDREAYLSSPYKSTISSKTSLTNTKLLGLPMLGWNI